MNTDSSVAGRALIAVGLMIGFYVLAVAIAGVLLYLPIAEFVYADRIHLSHLSHLRLALFAIVGAGTILWSIVPRWDRFEAPGPRLEPGQQPRLFEQIEGVASVTGQAMPSEVFLVGDVNAWVAQRGGVMGFFSRRVMGLGLPLLQTLTVSELRAVLAHEFGHYYGGDTKLGPWVYKTRVAIGRTIRELGDSWLNKPFLWYGGVFLRVSSAVSRQQEFSADALASRVVGSRPLVEGLKKLEAAASAYDSYWSSEIQPLLQAGFLPPIAEGFGRFAGQERVAQAMAGVIEQQLEQANADPHDTHPPLPERIAAVASLRPEPRPASDPRAVSLLADVRTLERDWLATVADASQVAALKAVAWESVFDRALAPIWGEAVAKNATVLGKATVADVASVVSGPLAAGSEGETAEQRAAFGRWLAAVATILALHRAGWTIEAPPGAPVTASREGVAIAPFEVVQRLVDGELTADAWRSEADRLGVGALRLCAQTGSPDPESE